MTSSNYGRHLFGTATIAAGVITLLWHDYNDSHQLRYLVYGASAGLIFGGVAVQFERVAKAGAGFLIAAYLVFVLLCVPGIIAAPRIYNSWGNFFEQFSLLTGAALILAGWSSARFSGSIKRIGRIALGFCATSFALEQAFYLQATAGLVPKWVPPSQVFWAVATTAFFGIAALALFINRFAPLASRLMTMMIVGFGVIVWIPLVVSNPRSHANWSESAETFAISGAMWVLADMLANPPIGHTREK